MATTSVRLDDELQDRLARLAERMRRTRGWIINEALEEYVSREELQEERYQQSLEALREAEAGDVIEGDEVIAWIESWGTENELPPPR